MLLVIRDDGVFQIVRGLATMGVREVCLNYLKQGLPPKEAAKLTQAATGCNARTGRPLRSAPASTELYNSYIGIWGKGIVGTATGFLFETKPEFKLFYYDKYKEVGDPKILLDNCDIIFLCLPTPMNKNGSVNLDYLENTLEEINKLEKYRKTLIIRSTVPPCSTDMFQTQYPKFTFMHCPEFLTEANSLRDIKRATRVMIGAYTLDDYEMLRKLFYSVYGSKVEYIYVTPRESESFKYLSNIFLSAQVMVANELYFICKKIGVNYTKLTGYLASDKRIGTHLQVPGPDGHYGIGGKCFPKDMNGFIYFAEQIGIKPKILKLMMEINDAVRDKVVD
jgi:nucleotide sugar dehydrogenase